MLKTNKFLNLALQQANFALLSDEVPVGAIVVEAKTGKLIAAAHNQTRIKKDPTAHAEMEVIRSAAQIKNSERLVDCDLYVTLEPCPMCAQAISFARIRRLYFAAYDIKGGGVYHGAKVFSSSSCHHKPEIYGGIMEKESGDLLKEFFKKKRHNQP